MAYVNLPFILETGTTSFYLALCRKAMENYLVLESLNVLLHGLAVCLFVF